MKIVQVSKNLLSPITLPGMGRSIDVAGISMAEVAEIRGAYSQGELFVTFDEEPDRTYPVIQLWVNPHDAQVTLFVK